MLYVLSPIFLVLSLRRYHRKQGRMIPLWRVPLDRRILSAGLLGVAMFALVHNLLFNFEGFKGHMHFITRIAPSSASESGVVNYPVTVQLANANIADVRPGMTAVATILDDEAGVSWLVPTSALVEGQGNTMVIILRDGQPTRVPVTSAGSQGEWTVVRSNELQAGDEAVGSVRSFLNQGDASGGFGPPGGGPGFGGAVRGAGGGRPQ